MTRVTARAPDLVFTGPVNPDRECERSARDNHGIISFEEARKAGLSEKEIAHKVAKEGWVSVHPLVYRLPGAPDTKKSRFAAAVKAAGPDALLSHRSAAELLGLDGISSGDKIEVVNHTGHQLKGVKVHRLRPIDRPRRMHVDGIPVTRMERVLIDLAGCLPIKVVGLALDDALRRRATTLARMWEELNRIGGRGRKGTKNLRVMLIVRDELDAEMRSAFEARMRRILKRIRGYEAIPNFRINTRVKTRYLDFGYRELPLGIECHSVDWHTGVRMKKDIKRDREFKNIGYEVLYFTWEEVYFEAEMVEREVRAAIRRRESLTIPQPFADNAPTGRDTRKVADG